MKLQLGTLATALFAATALALPTKNGRLAQRLAARAEAHKGHPAPMIPIGGQFVQNDVNGTKQVQYSSNWAGAVHQSPPAGETFGSITGQFTVPRPSVPTGGRGAYYASAWAGIDGDTYGGAILQAGCDFGADSSGATAYDCWYEWFPNPLTDFQGFTPAAGDVIQVDLRATSPTTGTAVLTNKNSGASVTQALTAPAPTNSLLGVNAEWIVEDFSSGGLLVPFADFDSVPFRACSADAGGQTVGTSGTTSLDIEQNGQVLTSVSYPDGSSVTVDYTG